MNRRNTVETIERKLWLLMVVVKGNEPQNSSSQHLEIPGFSA